MKSIVNSDKQAVTSEGRSAVSAAAFGSRSVCCDCEPSAAERVAAGTTTRRVRVVDGEALLLDRVGEVDGRPDEVRRAHPVDDDRDAGGVDVDVTVERPLVEEELVLQTRAAARLNRDPKAQIIAALLLEQCANLEGRRVCQRDIASRRLGRRGGQL